jgi:hypothetical protein
MRGREIEDTPVETVEAPQLALIGQVQEHQVQDTWSIEGIDVTLVEAELDFLHGLS